MVTSGELIVTEEALIKVLKILAPLKVEQEEERLKRLVDAKINVETALFVNRKIHEYNTQGVVDSLFTPTVKLKQYYQKFAQEQDPKYEAKCFKMIARIERWK